MINDENEEKTELDDIELRLLHYFLSLSLLKSFVHDVKASKQRKYKTSVLFSLSLLHLYSPK